MSNAKILLPVTGMPESGSRELPADVLLYHFGILYAGTALSATGGSSAAAADAQSADGRRLESSGPVTSNAAKDSEE